MAMSAQGLAWLPRSIIRSELAQGELVSLESCRRPAILLEIRLFRQISRLSRDAEAFWAAAIVATSDAAWSSN
jgi:DNA-binding transcriptional LysR family regulator